MSRKWVEEGPERGRHDLALGSGGVRHEREERRVVHEVQLDDDADASSLREVEPGDRLRLRGPGHGSTVASIAVRAALIALSCSSRARAMASAVDVYSPMAWARRAVACTSASLA